MRFDAVPPLAAVALLLSACCCPMNQQSTGASTTPSGPGSGPVTITPPTTPPGQPPSTPGQPPGPGYQVISGGQNVWPPQGPGCDRYVTCCNAASQLNGAISLSCRLAVATPPVDCTRALDSVKRTITEMNLAMPAACN